MCLYVALQLPLICRQQHRSTIHNDDHHKMKYAEINKVPVNREPCIDRNTNQPNETINFELLFGLVFSQFWSFHFLNNFAAAKRPPRVHMNTQRHSINNKKNFDGEKLQRVGTKLLIIKC